MQPARPNFPIYGVMLALLCACDSSIPSKMLIPGDEPLAKATIGAEGGTLQIKSGRLKGAMLSIENEVLTEPTPVSLREGEPLSGSSTISLSYALTIAPETTTFSSLGKAVLTLPFRSDANLGEGQILLAERSSSNEVTTRALDGKLIDGTASVTIQRFGTFQLVFRSTAMLASIGVSPTSVAAIGNICALKKTAFPVKVTAPANTTWKASTLQDWIAIDPPSSISTEKKTHEAQVHIRSESLVLGHNQGIVEFGIPLVSSSSSSTDPLVFKQGSTAALSVFVVAHADETFGNGVGWSHLVAETLEFKSLQMKWLALDDKDRILVAGDGGEGRAGCLWRVTAEGALDHTFDETGFVCHIDEPKGRIDDIAVDSTGRYITVEFSEDKLCDGKSRIALRRFFPSGSPDLNFSTKGIAYSPCPGPSPKSGRRTKLVIDHSGRLIVVSASDETMLLWRFTEAGSLDTTFGKKTGFVELESPFEDPCPNHDPFHVIVDSQNRLLIAGNAGKGKSGAKCSSLDDKQKLRPILWRFDEQGAADVSFAEVGWKSLPDDPNQQWGTMFSKIVEDGIGRYLVMSGDRFSGLAQGVWAFLANGAVDMTFGCDGFLPLKEGSYELIVDDAQRLWLARHTDTESLTLFSLLPDGKPDMEFGCGGILPTNFNIRGISHLRRDQLGRFILVGQKTTSEGLTMMRIDPALVRGCNCATPATWLDEIVLKCEK